MAFFVKFSPFFSNNIPRHDTQDVFYLNRLILDDQAVIEVQPEIPFLDFMGQILIRRRNDPDVDGDAMLTAYRTDILFLENPQQAVLQDIRHVSDFVEEQRPAIGRFKKAHFAIPVSSRKGPASIAEEFTFQQTFRNRPAVDRYKRAVPATAQIV